MVSFVPDVEDGGFAQLAQENQQRLWDMEDEANYWREEAMAHRTVVQRVTQDSTVCHVSANQRCFSWQLGLL